MSEANLNATIEGYRGAIGKLVFRNYKGRTIVSRKPVVTKEPTQGQLAQRQRFKDAVTFAKSAAANPGLRAFYEPIAKAKDITIYALAVADYLKTPEFQYIELEKYKGQVGDTIMIKAADDLGMAHVNVKLSAQNGTPIESGQALEEGAGSGKWIYTATVPVTLGTDIFIEANGADHAGTEVTISSNPIVGEDE